MIKKNIIGVVILAAGKGTRMKSDKLKVMHNLNGRPLVDWVVSAVEALHLKPAIIVNDKDSAVQDYLGNRANYVVQEKQLGTGHAVSVAENVLKNIVDHVVVLYGDMPFITPSSIQKLVRQHIDNGDVLTLMTATIDDFVQQNNFFDYGRIIRDEDDRIIKVVEKKDATPEVLKIREINTGYFCFEADWLWNNLKKLQNKNVQGEYYLTDLVKLAFEQKAKLSAISVSPREAMGINTLENLQKAIELQYVE